MTRNSLIYNYSYMPDSIFKVMLVGDVSTGKTSFLTQVIYHSPQRQPTPTKSLAFFTLALSNPQATLQLWDSPGDPRYHYQVVSSLKPFHALLLFIDITNQHTLNKAQTLLSQLRSYPRLQVHIIESKSDLVVKDPHKRKVSKEDLEAVARRVGGKVFTYLPTESVQDILGEVVAWKGREHESQSVQNGSHQPIKEGVSSTPPPACQCGIY